MGVAQGFEERLVVAVLEEDLATRITSVKDMMTDAALIGPSGAWHGLRIGGANGRCKQKDECPLFLSVVVY